MPDDPFISEMDPVQKIWMFYNWIGDQKDNNELAKNHAYLLGSFQNPEAVKKLLDKDKESFISTDEEFEETSKMVSEGQFDLPNMLSNNQQEPIFAPVLESKPTKKRKRRSIKG